jgi:alpha-galactosidase
MKIPSYTTLVTLAALAALQGPSCAAADGPVKVYILAGQSNMVGIGQVDSGGLRWGDEFLEPTLSVYEGAYDPKAAYDALKPLKTVALASFGGTEPTPFPGGGVQVVRGFILPKTTGVFEFRPGFGAAEVNVMVVAGVEAHRREPGGKAIKKSVKLEAGKKVPFKITFFTENASGLGWTARLDVPGTLTTVVKEQGKFPYLIDKDRNWVSRDDVWYKGVVTATANKWLSIGCGAGDAQIGPELGFGHIMGDFHEEPVLILKTSQGNRGLAWDFLPPGSERYEVGDTVYAGYKDTAPSWKKGEQPGNVNWYAGKQYDDCVTAAKDVLSKFDESFPQWKGRRYEIAGFVWFQGHKDTGSEVTASRYEQNLVRLIHSLRKDFNAPEAPFVVTVGCGNEGREGFGLTVAEAQLAVDGSKGKYAEFKGNVKTVETRDFFPKVEESPKDQGFHYHQNAGTYMQIGEAMGKGMLELLKAKP